MAKLIYSAIASLDGYVADRNGSFNWAVPDDEAHGFINELERSVGTHLFGRRMYEVMAFWETVETEEPRVRDYAEIWRAADKIVYSRTLESVASARTRIERDFDPESVRQLKAEADRDLTVGGPELAAEALDAGLVDECLLFLAPVLVGGGTPAFRDGATLRLELQEEHTFGSGMVFLRYAVSSSALPAASRTTPRSTEPS